MAKNKFRMFAVWQILLDNLLTLYRRQVLEQVAGRGESSYLWHSKKTTPKLTMGLAFLRDRRVSSH